MFDTYKLHTQPSSISVHSTVVENRAPTDESVKLLREMQKSAEQEIVRAIRLQNTEIDTVIYERKDRLQCKTTYLCVFKINGAKKTVEYVADEWDNKEKTAVGIRDAIAKEIATQILCSVPADITRNWN